MQPRANHYDPRGNGSLLQVGNILNATAVMFPYVTNDGDVEWALGLSDKTQAELDQLGVTAVNAPDKDAKRRVLQGIKTLAFSTLCRKGIVVDANGNTIDFEMSGTAAAAVRAIIVNDATTEASFAQAWNQACSAQAKTHVKAVRDMIATAQSGRKYRRVNVIDLEP